MSAGPQAEEEPSSVDAPLDAARRTARWARAPRGERMLWIACGAVLVVATVGLLLGARQWADGWTPVHATPSASGCAARCS